MVIYLFLFIYRVIGWKSKDVKLIVRVKDYLFYTRQHTHTHTHKGKLDKYKYGDRTTRV